MIKNLKKAPFGALTIDYLIDLDLQRVEEVFLKKDVKSAVPEC